MRVAHAWPQVDYMFIYEQTKVLFPGVDNEPPCAYDVLSAEEVVVEPSLGLTASMMVHDDDD